MDDAAENPSVVDLTGFPGDYGQVKLGRCLGRTGFTGERAAFSENRSDSMTEKGWNTRAMFGVTTSGHKKRNIFMLFYS